MKRVFIVGVSGQDGTLLANLLKARGIEYLGLNRQGLLSSDGSSNSPGKLTDGEFISDVVRSFLPTHVYYLAAHHHSSEETGLSRETNLWKTSLETQVLGLTNVLEALRLHAGDARLFYAASSHIFGSPKESPQNEETFLAPESVYGVTKVMGMQTCEYHHRKHQLFASTGILYNHESTYRHKKFLSQKIIQTALAIKAGRAEKLFLGSLSSRVDWGYAPDYVEAMIRILEMPEAGRYVIATGESHTVQEFVQVVFEQLGLDYREWVKEDPSIIRPQQSWFVGDSGKLRRKTGWAPSLSFAEMVRRLVIETRQHHPELNE